MFILVFCFTFNTCFLQINQEDANPYLTKVTEWTAAILAAWFLTMELVSLVFMYYREYKLKKFFDSGIWKQKW